MVDAFYIPRGEARFLPTPHTCGPWTPDAQHFGPPSALLVRALEQISAHREMTMTRVTVDILGPAPMTELTVNSGVVRPGRSVELLSAKLTANGRVVAQAQAWRMASSDTTAIASGASSPLPSPDSCPESEWPQDWHQGYLEAVEWRTIHGTVQGRGPAAVWARQRVALVDGEDPSPLQRLFTVADSGSGVSSQLDPGAWWFINSELTVHLERQPQDDWIGLDASTVIGPHGVGTARSRLHDTAGSVGTGAQALLVRPR